MPQQKAGLEYATPRKQIALFMEMRLGKTLTTIRWADQKRLKRILVLCPDASKDSWMDELRQEATADEDMALLEGPKRLEKAQGPGQWFLSTYQSVLYKPEVLLLQWDGIVLDESTAIRNPMADTTKLLQKHRERFNNRAILSGKPDPESPLDYFEQMRFVNGEFMECKDYWSFQRKYFRQGGYGGFEWQCTKATKERIKDEVGKQAFVMTRKQAGIGSAKIRETRTVEITPAQRAMVKQIQEDFTIGPVHVDDYAEDTKWIPVKYQWESQVAGGFSPHGISMSNAKTNEIKSLLKGELSNEAKVVVWFRYTQEILHVAAALNKAGIKAVIFKSDTKDQAKKFTHGDARVICAQAKCGQYSLNWACASTAIYYSNWYDGEVRAQTEDRIIHPKKKEPVLYIDLVAHGTIDEDVVSILRGKRLSSKEFMEELARRRSR